MERLEYFRATIGSASFFGGEEPCLESTVLLLNREQEVKMSLYHSFSVLCQFSFRSIKVLKPISLAICILLIFVVGKVSADYFVSTSGSDSNPGTEVSPFGSPQKAANVVSAGDTVYIMSGTYGGFTISKKTGTDVNWITFKPYRDDTVIIDAYANNYTNGRKVISVLGCTYIEINGLKITDSNPLWDSSDPKDYSRAIGYDGIKITNVGSSIVSHHIRIVNNELYHVGDMGILTDKESHFDEIINNNIHDTGLVKNGALRGHGIYLVGDDNIIRGNIFHDCYGYGIHVWSSYKGLNPDRNLIEENLCYNNGHSDSYDTRGDGIIVGSAGIDNIVQNNISYGNAGSGIMLYSSIDNTIIINNTIYNNNRYGIVLEGAGNTIDGTVVRNNISYNNAVNNYHVGSAVINTAKDHNLVGVDPKFVNASDGDFHLQVDSLAIDNGYTSGAPVYDYGGNLRLVDGNGDDNDRVDIGCYEYQGSAEVVRLTKPNLKIKED